MGEFGNWWEKITIEKKVAVDKGEKSCESQAGVNGKIEGKLRMQKAFIFLQWWKWRVLLFLNLHNNSVKDEDIPNKSFIFIHYSHQSRTGCFNYLNNTWENSNGIAPHMYHPVNKLVVFWFCFPFLYCNLSSLPDAMTVKKKEI